MALSIGDAAPDFESKTPKGDPFRLSDYRGKKNVVLFFYPGDFTPVCTKEACGFRDMYEELQAADTEVVGVSKDDATSHEKFAKEHDLAFPLLSDPGSKLAKLFGATHPVLDLLGRARRMTFLIDKTGTVRAILKGELQAKKHLDGVKAALAQLA